MTTDRENKKRKPEKDHFSPEHKPEPNLPVQQSNQR